MGSRQAIKEENAEAAPSSGFLGSILNSAGETYEQVKRSVTGATTITNDNSTTATTNEYKVVSEKDKGSNYSALGKAMEYKDYTSGRAKDAADLAMEKAKEERDVVSGRMSDMKETASIAVKRAMDHFAGKKEEEVGGDLAQVKYEKTEAEARKAMQELKLKEGVYDEEKQRARADWDTAADRGIAARSTIYGAMGTFKDIVKDKLTYPSDIVEEARATQEYGGPKRGRGDKLVDDVEEGPSGPAAMPSAKASD